MGFVTVSKKGHASRERNYSLSFDRQNDLPDPHVTASSGASSVAAAAIMTTLMTEMIRRKRGLGWRKNVVMVE